MSGFELRLLLGTYAVSRLSPDEPCPDWARGELLASIRTPDELSIVSRADSVPQSVRSESGWRVLQVAGPLDFSLVGVLAALSAALARVDVTIFSLSSFDTDYLLITSSCASRISNARCALWNRAATE